MTLAALRRLIDTHAGSTAIDDVTVSKVTRPTRPTASLSQPMLAVVAAGEKQIVCGDRVLTYGAGQYLVVTVDMPVTGHFVRASQTQPCLGVGLALRATDIAAMMLETGLAAGRRAPTAPALAVSQTPPELVDATVRLLRLLENPTDRAVLAPMIKREILWRLLTGEQGEAVAQIGLADSTLSAVSRAMQWIREHYAEPLRIDDLARLSRMSTSSFHRHFRTVTAMTPLQFQKTIRLQEARLLLLSRPDDVTRTGHAVGYDSPSQFSREYRRMFGEPPGRDAARLRRSDVAVDEAVALP